MKTNLGFLIVAVVAGGFLGFGLEKLWASQRRMAGGSVARQTLADISRALELENGRSGAYPDSLSGLEVLPSGGDFSQAVLQRVVYRKTANGYVAFIGSPDVVYIEPGKSARHQ